MYSTNTRIFSIVNTGVYSNIKMNPSIRNKRTSYIKLFLDILYFICWSPFRIKNNSEGISTIERANYLRIGINVMMILGRIYWDIFFIRMSLLDLNMTKGKAVLIKYFDMICWISAFFWSYVMIDSLWKTKRQSQFLRLHQLIQHSIVCQELHRHVGLKFIVLILLQLGTAIMLFPVRLDLQSDGDPLAMFKGLVYWGKLFTFDTNPNSQFNYTDFSEFDIKEWACGLGALVTVVLIRVQDTLGTYFMLLTGLLLWESCVSFEKVWRHEYVTASNILTQYEELKRLAEVIEQCDGRKTSLTFINLLVFLSTRIDSIFLLPDWFLWVGFMYEFFQPAAFAIFSCEVCRKMQLFRDWLMRWENQGIFKDKEMKYLLTNLSRTSVGISGCGLFKINYTFLGHAMALLVTYFIVVIQSRDKN